MRKLLITAAGAALMAGSVAATAGEGLYMGPSMSVYHLDSDTTVGGSDESGVVGFNLGYRFFNDWALEAGVGRDVFGDDMDVAKLDALYFLGNPENDSSWRPYLVGGVTYMEREDSGVHREDVHSHLLSAGVGMSRMMADQWEVRADARVLQGVRDNEYGTTHAALNLAFNYYFNKPAAAPVVESEPAPAVQPEPEPETRTITVRLNVEFEFDKAVVRAIYGDELRAIANAMKTHDDIDLVLEGHTDSIGTDTYNQDLSERRAAAVKAKIAQDYGIDSSRISTVGYGESRPIADNSTDEGRARNRRVIGELSYTEVVAD